MNLSELSRDREFVCAIAIFFLILLGWIWWQCREKKPIVKEHMFGGIKRGVSKIGNAIENSAEKVGGKIGLDLVPDRSTPPVETASTSPIETPTVERVGVVEPPTIGEFSVTLPKPMPKPKPPIRPKLPMFTATGEFSGMKTLFSHCRSAVIDHCENDPKCEIETCYSSISRMMNSRKHQEELDRIREALLGSELDDASRLSERLIRLLNRMTGPAREQLADAIREVTDLTDPAQRMKLRQMLEKI